MPYSRVSRPSRMSGFSLLEMSLVLVIISFLVGGIVVGRSMIGTAQVRAVIEESQAYLGAVRTFKDKYLGLPGDLANAESFWGTAAAGAGCLSLVSTGTATCNGDGDGNLGYTTHSAELFRAWQQMANAGLVAGSYSGVDPNGSGAYYGVPGTNVPASKLKPGGYDLFYLAKASGDASANYYNGNYGNVLAFRWDPNPSGTPGILTPADARTIDSKTDDGYPSTGKTVSVKSPLAPGCTTSNSSSTATYNIATTSLVPTCSLLFLTGF